MDITFQPNSGEFPENTVGGGVVLDYTISDEEINLASYIFRKGKATGLLSTKPEMINKLFNSILLNLRIINKWQISMISPIHKKGSKLDPDNWGISLLSCL